VVLKERLKTDGRVVDAGCEAEKRVSALSGVLARIASVRWRWGQKRSTRGRERAAGEDECECAKTKTAPQSRPVD